MIIRLVLMECLLFNGIKVWLPFELLLSSFWVHGTVSGGKMHLLSPIKTPYLQGTSVADCLLCCRGVPVRGQGNGPPTRVKQHFGRV